MDVREFQSWMEAHYGARDRARGLHATFAWFVEEVGEVSQALRKGTREQQEHEFADAFAWLVSVASLAGIDVQTALERYAQGCPKCTQSPCVCGHGGDSGDGPQRSKTPPRADASHRGP